MINALMTAIRKRQSRGERTQPDLFHLCTHRLQAVVKLLVCKTPTSSPGFSSVPCSGAAPKIPVLADCTWLAATIAWSCFLFLLEHFSKRYFNISPWKEWNVFLVEHHTVHFCLPLILFSMTTWPIAFWWCLNTPKVTSLYRDAQETAKVVLLNRIPEGFSSSSLFYYE